MRVQWFFVPSKSFRPGLLIGFSDHDSWKDILDVVLKAGNYEGWDYRTIPNVDIVFGMRTTHKSSVIGLILNPWSVLQGGVSLVVHLQIEKLNSSPNNNRANYSPFQ